MDRLENFIPDSKGNHLVVVLYLYDDDYKRQTLLIPDEFVGIDIADINIRKLDINAPIGLKAWFDMCNWLLDQAEMFTNMIFCYTCSIESLDNRHYELEPKEYRWNLFNALNNRYSKRLEEKGINTQDIYIGDEEFGTYARIYYRSQHSPIIYLVTDHLLSKYSNE